MAASTATARATTADRYKTCSPSRAARGMGDGEKNPAGADPQDDQAQKNIVILCSCGCSMPPLRRRRSAKRLRPWQPMSWSSAMDANARPFLEQSSDLKSLRGECSAAPRARRGRHRSPVATGALRWSQAANRSAVPKPVDLRGIGLGGRSLRRWNRRGEKLDCAPCPSRNGLEITTAARSCSAATTATRAELQPPRGPASALSNRRGGLAEAPGTSPPARQQPRLNWNTSGIASAGPTGWADCGQDHLSPPHCAPSPLSEGNCNPGGGDGGLQGTIPTAKGMRW